MNQMPKRLVLLIFVILLSTWLAACAPGEFVENGPVPLATNDPLRATLSALQTVTARQQETPVPAVTPAGDSAVPLTGGTDAPPPAAELQDPSPAPTYTPYAETAAVPQVSPTSGCMTEESKMLLSASKEKVKVGETVDVKVVLSNTGCLSLGLPQYRLVILNSEAQPMFTPNMPDPVEHSLAVNPGESDEASFTLRAANPGKATLNVMASFEVHQGYPGPAYWGASSSSPLVIVVEP